MATLTRGTTVLAQASTSTPQPQAGVSTTGKIKGYGFANAYTTFATISSSLIDTDIGVKRPMLISATRNKATLTICTLPKKFGFSRRNEQQLKFRSDYVR